MRRFVLFLLLLTMAGAAACSSRPAETPTKKNLPKAEVAVETVRPRAMLDVMRLPGSTEAFLDITVAAERGGKVESVPVREGGRVSPGDLVASVDTQALAAALDKAQAEYDLAQAQARRKSQLMTRGVISHEELDQALTNERATAGVLREARVNRAQGRTTAPAPGIVDKRHVEPGEYVQAGDPVVDLVDISKVKINVDVPEMDVKFVHPGDSVDVTVDAWPGRSWTGIVDHVAYKADSATKTFEVRVVIDNPDGAVRPGMLARTAFIRRNIADALSAPLSAVVERGGERFLFVESDGLAQARKAGLGVVHGDRIQVTSGLAPGENLVVRGQDNLEDGMGVAVK